MRVWLIYDKHHRQTQHMVFETKDAADAYVAKFGNPNWLVEWVPIMDRKLVDGMD